MTLSQTSVFTRKAIVIFFALVVFGIIVKTIISISYNYYQSCCIPVKVLKPDYIFGTGLKGPNLPKSLTSTNTFTYSIDTTTGDLPKDLPAIMKVYAISPSSVTLLSSDRAINIAKDLQFPTGPEKVSDTIEKFTDSSNGSMTIDISTDNFTFTRPQNPVNTSSSLPNPQDNVSIFKNYLGKHNLIQKDLNNGRTNVTYDGPSIAESNTVTVSIWPEDINKIKIATPDFNNGLIQATIGKTGSSIDQFLKFTYYYWTVNTQTYALYPIKTPQQALDELKAGNAYLSQTPPTNQVSITNVDIYYYESPSIQAYLFPIYVFQGPQFSAYVPAITQSTPQTKN